MSDETNLQEMTVTMGGATYPLYLQLPPVRSEMTPSRALARLSVRRLMPRAMTLNKLTDLARSNPSQAATSRSLASGSSWFCCKGRWIWRLPAPTTN